MKKNIRGEIEFLCYLGENSFSAMKPLKAKNGEYLLKIDTQWRTFFVCAFDGVEGEQIESTDLSDDIMLEYGRTLARLHNLSKQYSPATKKWDYTEVSDYIREILEKYNASEKMKKELDNVFYDSRTKSCNVIDFDDSMYHWFALDIEQVFGSINEDCDGDKDRAKKLFLQGYREIRTFTDEDEKLLPLMRRFCNINAYAQLIRSVAEKLENEPEWLLWLRKKFADKIKLLDKENAVAFLKYDAGELVGFAQCQLRYDYVEGTETLSNWKNTVI